MSRYVNEYGYPYDDCTSDQANNMIVVQATEFVYKDEVKNLTLSKSKIQNGSKFIVGGKLSQVQLTLDQHFNWFQKLMWKWCFGVKVEDYSEE